MVRSARTPGAGSGPASGPSLVPCLMLRKGEVCLPGENGPEVARNPAGAPYDPFDVVDLVREQYDRLYLVDLDGIEKGDPQLAYLQELSRDISLWVDAGVPTADAAIDIVVAGADRAVLSTAYLRGPVEIRRAWKLSTDWVFEVEIAPSGALVASSAWPTRDPVDLVASVREVGIQDLVVSPRERAPDWELVGRLAAGGPTWVAGSFRADELPRLRETRARGGIFHLDTLLEGPPRAPSPDPIPNASARDDED